MSNARHLLLACTRQRTAASIVGQQYKTHLQLTRHINTHKLDNNALADKHWSQKQERILYNTVTSEYLDIGKEIDWANVSRRVSSFNNDMCKTRFYQLQRQLADRTSSKGSIWTRREIERLVAGADKADTERLKRSDHKWRLEWADLAKEHSNNRSPDECKRIYTSYRHLCKVRPSWNKNHSGTRFIGSVVGLLILAICSGTGVEWLYYYIEGDQSTDL